MFRSSVNTCLNIQVKCVLVAGTLALIVLPLLKPVPYVMVEKDKSNQASSESCYFPSSSQVQLVVVKFKKLKYKNLKKNKLNNRQRSQLDHRIKKNACYTPNCFGLNIMTPHILKNEKICFFSKILILYLQTLKITCQHFTVQQQSLEMKT